jgi:hypothetical protein
MIGLVFIGMLVAGAALGGLPNDVTRAAALPGAGTRVRAMVPV